jgi:Holliday junction resolvase RusA-like endonuclease
MTSRRVTSVRVTILGKLPRKDNQRRIVQNRATGARFVVKSQEALAWMAAAKMQLCRYGSPRLGSEEHPLRIEACVFYPWKFKGDLSVELLHDGLSLAGIISDDRYIVSEVLAKCYDAAVPRVVVEVVELEDWDWSGGSAHPALE